MFGVHKLSVCFKKAGCKDEKIRGYKKKKKKKIRA